MRSCRWPPTRHPGGAAITPGFLATSLIIVVSPGTGVLYTLAAGLSRGKRASIIAAFGCTLGIEPHMAAAVTGFASAKFLLAGVESADRHSS